MRLVDAERVAAGLVELLRSACERIEIAGSVRRRKETVKDVEIVYVPRYREERRGQASMLDAARNAVQVNLVDELVDEWLACGIARPRLSKVNVAAMGERHKRLLIDYGEPGFEGVSADLFAVLPGTPSQWGLQMMIRTGSGVGPEGDPRNGFGPGVLARWKSVSGGGYSMNGCLHWPDARPCFTPEEDDVWAACQMRPVPPERRTHAGVVKEYVL